MMRFDKTWVAVLVASAAWLGACEKDVEPSPTQAVASTAAPAAAPTSAAKQPANDATEPAKMGDTDEANPNVDGTASPGRDGVETEEEAQ